MALDREKNKVISDKCQALLTGLLKDEDNKYCVDCDAKSPRWASWNIGIFLCIRCAGIHRNLGVHISKVKSVNLDSWTPQQVACIQQMGNSRARAVYEANLQDNFRRPQNKSSLEQFIRAKYETKKYIAKEWVPPEMPHPTWDIELEKQLRKKKEKKPVSGRIELPAQIKSKTTGVSPKPLPKAPGTKVTLPKLSSKDKNVSANNGLEKCDNKSSGTLDLLGLDCPSTTPTTIGSSNVIAEDSNDIFGDFLAAPTIPLNKTSESTSAVKKEVADKDDESNFFNQKLPESSSSEKMTKDSILALYSNTPSQPQQMYNPTNMFNISGVPTANNMAGIVPQRPQVGVPILHGIMPPQAQIPNLQQPSMFYQRPGVPAPGMQSQFYSPQGVGGSSGVFPMMPGGVQLSAANPFSQMQAQMGNMCIGGPMGVQQPPNIQPMGFNALDNLNALNQQPNNSLATNLWQ